MSIFNKTLVMATTFVLASAALILVPGCQANQASVSATQPAAAAPSDQAVTCDKCRTVWVMRSSRNFKGMITYSRKPKMVCEDCTSAAANFFKTGKLEHTCKSCGGSLEACEAHRQ